MADDPRLSDDEVRAAARRWLIVPGRTYTSIVDSLLPGELSRERVGLAERLLEWTPDRLAAENLPPYFASTQARMEAEDALALAGFEPHGKTVASQREEKLAKLTLDELADVLSNTTSGSVNHGPPMAEFVRRQTAAQISAAYAQR